MTPDYLDDYDSDDMYDNFEDFYELSIQDQNTFYLFPMIGYIIVQMMDRLI